LRTSKKVVFKAVNPGQKLKDVENIAFKRGLGDEFKKGY